MSALLDSKVTDGSGWVAFAPGVPGTCTVCEVLQDGWANSQPDFITNSVYNKPCYTRTFGYREDWTFEFGNYQLKSDLNVTKVVNWRRRSKSA